MKEPFLTPSSMTSLQKRYFLNVSQDFYLDISKAFHNVWHYRLIYKCKSYGVENKLLNLIQNYFTNRQQIILLNGRTSKWTDILAGVLHGFILGPLLFLIYINDWSDGLKSICNTFADDTSLFWKVIDVDTSNVDMNNDLESSFWNIAEKSELLHS